MKMKIQNSLKACLFLTALTLMVSAVSSKATVTIIYEVAEITSGGSNISSGTLLFISHGADNNFNSNSWTQGTSSFLRGDDVFFAAVPILNGVASGNLAAIDLPAGATANTTKFTGLFINGLTSSDINYSNGSLLNGKIFGSLGSGASYNFGSYRTDSIESFGGAPTGNIAWIFPADGAGVSLSAYSNTGDYTGATNTANLATSGSFVLVPEPSTSALMMIGAAGLVALRRLRKV